MIYNKGIDIRYKPSPEWIKQQYFLKLSAFGHIQDHNPVFYLDRHDIHQRHIKFSEFINEEHWAIVREKKAKILIDYSDEYFNVADIISIAKTLCEKNIPSDQVHMVVMDPLWQTFALKHFHQWSLFDVQVVVLPWLLHTAISSAPRSLTIKNPFRFSLLSRNYRLWRLDLMLGLCEHNLLGNNIKYSFHNIEPYDNTVFTKEHIMQDAITLKGYISDTLAKWIDKIPYDTGSVKDKFFNGTYHVIKNSGVHILVESHHDPYQTDSVRLQYSTKFAENEWSPAFATEKFYKTILCQTPFIAVTTPGFLKEIKEMGYKTFSPFIDESYDEISNDRKRIQAVVKEIERLNNLSDDDFWSGVSYLESITKHNSSLLSRLYATKPKINWDFLNDYINYIELPNFWKP
jgi:hypothetical protein